MSRILVVGVDGVDGCEATVDLGPSRRTRQFASAIADAGHDVVALRLDRSTRRNVATLPPGRSVGGRTIAQLSVPADRFSSGQGPTLLRKIAPDGIVAATVHASSLVARAVDDGVPLWVDVFGDPMAEAQAKAVVDGHDLALARYWEALVAAIDRGDHFSAVSQVQAHALVGQLGLAGRLTRASAGSAMVSVIPCGAEHLDDDTAAGVTEEAWPHEAFLVLFSGSFNTWCDVETMFDGVEAAMDAVADIHFVVTGGAVPGHDEQTYERFHARLRQSRHLARVHVLGWVDRARLARVYAGADVGLNIERKLYERTLGAENRVVEWLRHGIPAVTTAGSESGRELVRLGLAFGTRTGDPDALARRLVELSRNRDCVRGVGRRCAEHAERTCSFAVTARPLVEWCAAPRPAARAAEKRLRVALASEPQALSGLLEAYLAEIPPHRLAYRSVRWLWRRFAYARGAREQRT